MLVTVVGLGPVEARIDVSSAGVSSVVRSRNIRGRWFLSTIGMMSPGGPSVGQRGLSCKRFLGRTIGSRNRGRSMGQGEGRRGPPGRGKRHGIFEMVHISTCWLQFQPWGRCSTVSLGQMTPSRSCRSAGAARDRHEHDRHFVRRSSSFLLTTIHNEQYTPYYERGKKGNNHGHRIIICNLSLASEAMRSRQIPKTPVIQPIHAHDEECSCFAISSSTSP